MRWKGVVACVAASALACSGEKLVGPDANATLVRSTLTGVYELASINANGLPQFVGRDGLGDIDVVGGVIQLNDDATYTDILSLRRRGGHGIVFFTDTIHGGYMHFGATLMLQPSDGNPLTFMDIRSDGSLMNAMPGFYLLYKRD